MADRGRYGIAKKGRALGRRGATIRLVAWKDRELSVIELFLPESWTSDPQRMTQVRVLEERHVVLSKPEIALEEIDRVIASDARFGCVLADSGYGPSGPFRRALSASGPNALTLTTSHKPMSNATMPCVKLGKHAMRHRPAPASSSSSYAAYKCKA
jgi:SRSO17 transposase